MATIRISEDLLPISEFKARAADILKRVAKNDQPVVLTQNGKAAGVLLSPAEYDRLTEHSRLMAAIDEGLRDDEADRVTPHEEAVRHVMNRLASKTR